MSVLSLRHLLPALAGAALVLGGCSKDATEASVSTSGDPSSADIQSMQQAASSQILFAETSEALGDALTAQGQSGAPKAVAWRADGYDLPLAVMGATPRFGGEVRQNIDFDFDQTFTVEVDLDEVVGGADRYPNSTGVFTINGQVLAQNDSGAGAGSVSLALSAVADTDLTATNPDTGDSVSLPAGTSLLYAANLDWSKTDDQNWSVSLSITGGPNANTVFYNPAVGPDVSGELQTQYSAAYSLSAVAGRISWSADVTGNHTAVWQDTLGNQNTVSYDIVGPNRILVTINGTPYGPFTRNQLRRLYLVYLGLRATRAS